MHVVGEVTTTAKEAFADITNTVRARILDIGYDSSEKGFDGETCGVNIGDRRAVARISRRASTPPTRRESRARVTRWTPRAPATRA